MTIKIVALIVSALFMVGMSTGCGTYTGARVRCDRTLGSHLCSTRNAAPVRTGKADPIRPRQAGTPAGKQL